MRTPAQETAAQIALRNCSKEAGEERSVYMWFLVKQLFSHSVVSDSLQAHGLQHARLPSPSLAPGVCSNSCPLSLWCHPTISSSVAPFSSCPQSFPTSGSFPVNQVTKSCFGFSICPSNDYSGLISFRIDWFDLLAVFSDTTVRRHQFFGTQPSLWSNSHIHTWLLEKP